MHWKTTTALICLYGILKKFRPATPFLTPYLASDYKNLTLDEIYGEIFPYWTYSYMVFLLPVLVLTDILRYKPIIIIEGASLSLTWALLVWGEGVFQMQIMQVVFGLASASEIAYYSYMYAVVDEKKYKRVTSYIRSAALVGKLLAFGVAQTLVSTGTGSYLLLNQISLAAVSLVFFIALALPRAPSKKITQDIHCELLEQGCQPGQEDTSCTDSEQKVTLTRAEVERRKLEHGVYSYLVDTIKNFGVFKENTIVLKWSLWWALASCGIFQVYNYIQALWLEMQPDPDKVENGLTEFMNTLLVTKNIPEVNYILLGAILAFAIQFADVDWHRYGELTLIVSSLLIGIILIAISQTSYVLVAYVGYVSVTSIYHALITAASCNIATELTSTNYGLVFGWNTFVAVVLQTLLTLLVADSHGFNLNMRTQFVVYGLYFVGIGALFLVVSTCSKLTAVPEVPDTAEGAEEVRNDKDCPR
ncbi:reduced folate carrier [Oesophagostomum dentatum]|uniref:Reduced folate carrier n=1 Tax=Oesophagostomum dentatum TaxID=61180 RepID=A0A0B1TPS8_OESDE|nr:reduced folate carrier [Oesophagostomum dentatum]